VFGACYFAPNICSSPPSADDVHVVLHLDRAARHRWLGGGAQYYAAVTGILTALSILAALLFTALMGVALTEALDAHRRRQ
jgi:hypothetical protein